MLTLPFCTWSPHTGAVIELDAALVEATHRLRGEALSVSRTALQG